MKEDVMVNQTTSVVSLTPRRSLVRVQHRPPRSSSCNPCALRSYASAFVSGASWGDHAVLYRSGKPRETRDVAGQHQHREYAIDHRVHQPHRLVPDQELTQAEAYQEQ